MARRVQRSDVSACNRRRQALAWLRRTYPRPRLVQDGFASLGYPDLETACEQDRGFARMRAPNRAERRYLAVVEELVPERFPRVVPEDGLPAVRIIENAEAAWKGLSGNVAADDARLAGGDRVRYRQSFVALDRTLLVPGRFADALATYLHELAHVHGTDRSAAFSAALTDLIASAVREAGELVIARQRWLEAAGRAPPTGRTRARRKR